MGPGRGRQHLGSTAVRWVHTRNGAVHGICDAWLLAADAACQPSGLRTAIRDDDAVGADTAVPVPSCAAPCAGKRRVRGGLQRNADVGGATGSLRQPDDSDVARFWSGNGTLYWNRIATQLAAARHRTLVENAHLFAVLHIAMADASIATWDAKYRYVFWRPVTAIPSLDDDGNASTDPDPSWTPFLTTSAHPEYPSGHSNSGWRCRDRSRCDVRRRRRVRRELRNHAGHSAVIRRLLERHRGDGQRARLRRDALPDRVRTRQRPWGHGRRIRSAARDASAARRLGRRPRRRAIAARAVSCGERHVAPPVPSGRATRAMLR